MTIVYVVQHEDAEAGVQPVLVTEDRQTALDDAQAWVMQGMDVCFVRDEDMEDSTPASRDADNCIYCQAAPHGRFAVSVWQMEVTVWPPANKKRKE